MKEFIIEVLGIDGKGLRLMRDIFWRPKRVFADFADETHKDYAPPLRVWLWVYGIHVLLLVLTGGAGEFFAQINAGQGENNFFKLLERVGVDSGRFTEVAGDWWTFGNPILVLIFSIPAAAILGLFRRELSFSVHANIYLSCFLASSLVTLPLMPFIIEWMPSHAGLSGLLNALVFAATFLRGGHVVPYYQTAVGGVIRAVVITLVFFLSTVIASMVMMFGIALIARG